MHSIHIVFPPKGEPVVAPPIQPMLVDDAVVWDIINQNDRVASCAIHFPDENATFFYPNDPPNRMQRHLRDGKLIWGKAPEQNCSQTSYKYWIVGYDDRGREVTLLDPTIIVDDPGK